MGQQLVGCLLTKPTKALPRFSAYRWDSQGTSLPPKYDMPRNSGPENYEQNLLIRTALVENNTHQEWVRLLAEQSRANSHAASNIPDGASTVENEWLAFQMTPLAITSWASPSPSVRTTPRCSGSSAWRMPTPGSHRGIWLYSPLSSEWSMGRGRRRLWMISSRLLSDTFITIYSIVCFLYLLGYMLIIGLNIYRLYRT